MNALYKLLIVACAAVFLSACASQSAEDSTDETVYTDTAATSGANASGANDYDADPEAALQNTFYFDLDSASLNFESRSALDGWASVLSSNPRAIRLEGHGDERGSREYNIALGERRAKTVSNYLVSAGVASSLIETISYLSLIHI